MKCSDLSYHCKSARLCVRHSQMKTHLNYFIKFHWQCYKKLLDRKNCFLKVTYSTSVLVSLNISSSKINYITRERQKYKSLLLMTTVQGNSLPLRCNYLSFGVVSPPQRSPHASLWSWDLITSRRSRLWLPRWPHAFTNVSHSSGLQHEKSSSWAFCPSPLEVRQCRWLSLLTKPHPHFLGGHSFAAFLFVATKQKKELAACAVS